MKIGGAVFQPEDITLMRSALDAAAVALPIALRTSSYKAALAERILLHAAQGERDPTKLKTAAVLEVMTGSITTHDISAARRAV
jgi:hypothetical protein